MNKEQQKLLDDAYENYWNSHPDADKIFQYEGSSIVTRRMTEDEFVDMVKTDTEFSERWGLKIEERELSDKERVILYGQKTNIDTSFFPVLRETLNFHNIPTKLITITYNDKTIEGIGLLTESLSIKQKRGIEFLQYQPNILILLI
jgi:hypothetical protein